MSHWVLEPIVLRTRDKRVVVSLEGSSWDGGGVTPTFPRRNQVELHLRRYPEGAPTFDLVIEVEEESWWFADRPNAKQGTASLIDELERVFEHRVEKTAPDYLAQGICPNCKAQLYPPKRVVRRLLGNSVQCLVCARRWELPG